MNPRLLVPFVLAALSFASSGCDFDFGGVDSSAPKTTPVLLDDGGVATQPNITNGQDPCFVPCQGAYGTNCGWICH